MYGYPVIWALKQASSLGGSLVTEYAVYVQEGCLMWKRLETYSVPGLFFRLRKHLHVYGRRLWRIYMQYVLMVAAVVLFFGCVGAVHQTRIARKITREFHVPFSTLHGLASGFLTFAPWGVNVMVRPTWATQVTKAAVMATMYRGGFVTRDQVKDFIEREQIPKEILHIT